MTADQLIAERAMELARNIDSLCDELRTWCSHTADEAVATIATLRAALDESVKLQSHYAGLLNTYDGGARMQFDSADAWIKRLAEISARSPLP